MKASYCFRRAGLMLVRVSGSPAPLNSPTWRISASTPSRSSIPLKNIISARTPVSSSVAAGGIATVSQAAATA